MHSNSFKTKVKGCFLSSKKGYKKTLGPSKSQKEAKTLEIGPMSGRFTSERTWTPQLKFYKVLETRAR